MPCCGHTQALPGGEEELLREPEISLQFCKPCNDIRKANEISTFLKGGSADSPGVCFPADYLQQFLSALCTCLGSSSPLPICRCMSTSFPFSRHSCTSPPRFSVLGLELVLSAPLVTHSRASCVSSAIISGELRGKSTLHAKLGPLESHRPTGKGHSPTSE